MYTFLCRGHAVAQLVEALSYKPEDRGFDSRCCYRNYSLASSFRPQNGPGVNSASNRNEYQEYFVWGKGGRCVGLTTLQPSCADCHEIWEPQPPGTLRNCPACNGIASPFYPYISFFCFLCWKQPSYLTNCANVKYVGCFPDTVYQDLAHL